MTENLRSSIDWHEQFSQPQLERLRAIDFRVYFLGEVRRTDVMEQFAVGGASATRDLALYRAELGGKIELDSADKVYVRQPGFKPIFDHECSRVLAALAQGARRTSGMSNNSLIPAFVPPELSLPQAEVVAPITRAVHKELSLQVTYHSFSSGAQSREIVPHAIAHNGLRWHVRAFDRKREKFIDFVLTRFETAKEQIGDEIADHETVKHDIEWGRIIELELVPHPKEDHPAIVAMDYNMADGVRRVRVRAALAAYLLRQWIVDCSPDHSLNGIEYRLWLRNAPALYGAAAANLAPGYQAP